MWNRWSCRLQTEMRKIIITIISKRWRDVIALHTGKSHGYKSMADIKLLNKQDVGCAEHLQKMYQVYMENQR